MMECEEAEVKLHIFFNSGPYGPGKLQAGWTPEVDR